MAVTRGVKWLTQLITSPFLVPISANERPASCAPRKSATTSGERIGYASTAEKPENDGQAEAPATQVGRDIASATSSVPDKLRWRLGGVSRETCGELASLLVQP